MHWVMQMPPVLFQSTPSRGGRPYHVLYIFAPQQISIHALTRRATDEIVPYVNNPRISIHALTRRATSIGGFFMLKRSISIHALTRRATCLSWTMRPWRKRFQSTPSRGGRQAQNLFCVNMHIISIHALTRRATQIFGCNVAKLDISIHALTRRATIVNNCKQKTSRISIHALTRRATSSVSIYDLRMNKFQSTPSRGGRPHLLSRANCHHYFNPRPHEEGDILILLQLCISSNFNPRPHEEGDIENERLHYLHCISIHALTRRATRQRQDR